MPIVETSVAVATPSTTALRIRKGSAIAGNATIKVLRTTENGARATGVADLFLPGAIAGYEAEHDGQN